MSDMPNLNDLIGKPFEFGSYGPKTYDCYGICYEVYNRLGKELPKFLDYTQKYAEIITKEYSSEIAENYIDLVLQSFQKIENPEPYCLVLFSLNREYTTHVGIVLKDCKRFIHTSQRKNCVIERLDSVLWIKKIVGFYRYAESN
jgi:cell wall-associated NlpC family hydrolase